MYLSKGKKWKRMEWNGFSREMNGVECNLKILFGSNMEGME